MPSNDLTSMGGPNRWFQTTDWAEILRARTQDEDLRRAAMGELIGRYWKPVYGYLRRKGHGNDAAKDLTQGFFEEVVLGRGLAQMADPAKGRFRNFLLLSLERYVKSVHRAKTAKKRRPETRLINLDGIESFETPEPSHAVTPEAVFNHNWAATLLEQVLEEVEGRCDDRGEETYWELFRVRVLIPVMEDSEPPALAEVCAWNGIPNTRRASNMIVTVKRRFRAALIRHVRRLVASDADVDQEIDDLFGALAEGGAT
jgi:DNA-directed RNA polymerase specialized sigma24 family protein